MTGLHPRWHATGEDLPPRSREELLAPDAAPVRIPVASAAVSRLPSAVLGILLVTGIGILYAGGNLFRIGWGALGGPSLDFPMQMDIRITAAGLDPAEADVRPGQTVVWHNEQELPHILQSATVQDQSGNYLYSPAIFPGSTYAFMVSPSLEPGRHDYASLTSQDVIGALIVTDGDDDGTVASASSSGIPTEEEQSASSQDAVFTTDTDDAASSRPVASSSLSSRALSSRAFSSSRSSAPAASSERASSAASRTQEPMETDIPTLPAPASDEESSAQARMEDLLPINPYQIGAQGTPVSAGSSRSASSARSAASRPALHGAACVPGQAGCVPDTVYESTKAGPELWLVLAGSIAAFVWTGRRTLFAGRE
ncbi:MAG: hypothetical protein PHW10_00590 [Candidatus Peribacteraceae bacterium]|nr:hypothetical protein [Candidatus Peribacteraceae bacterium]